MRLNFSPDILTLLEIIQTALEPGQNLYLVGGAVRDALLGRDVHDLDFVMNSDPTLLAKRVARQLKVGFFVLDDDRCTTRVLYHTATGKLSPLDFVQFTGDDLFEDLSSRDYTINAIAVSVRDTSTLIDPLGGERDLKRKVLRVCSQSSLLDDPVRVLRGIRLARQFGLQYDTGVEALMSAAAVNLPSAAMERQRDELVRILEGPDPALGIADCRSVSALQALIPDLIDREAIGESNSSTFPQLDHTIRVVDFLSCLINVITETRVTAEDSWWLGSALRELGPFNSHAQIYFTEELTPGRSKKGLTLLGALFCGLINSDVIKTGEHEADKDHLGEEAAWEAAKRLQFSNLESAWIKSLVGGYVDLTPLLNRHGLPTRREVYHFYLQSGDAGVAIAFLGLASHAAADLDESSSEKWKQAVLVVKALLSAWWERYDEVISPSLMLNGDDLQSMFGLDPGKKIGSLLSQLREAQASGDVRSKAEAEVFIENHLLNKRKGEHR